MSWSPGQWPPFPPPTPSDLDHAFTLLTLSLIHSIPLWDHRLALITSLIAQNREVVMLVLPHALKSAHLP